MKNLKDWRRFNENGDSDLDIRNPRFTDDNAEDFLTRLGISITKATGEYKPGVPEEPNVNIRSGSQTIIYGFKVESDYENFKKYVSDNNIEYRTSDSKGARYPYHVILSR